MHNRTELNNYLLRLKSPKFFYFAIHAFLNAAVWALFRRIAPNLLRNKFIPLKIFKARSRVLQKPVLQTCLYPNNPIRPKKLKLAAGSIEFRDCSSWEAQFSDEEVTTSLHRWGWLLAGGADDNSLSLDEGLTLIRSWLSSCISNEVLRSDPYSAGERIVNSSLFLLINQCDHIPKDIQEALGLFARQIASNLEYYEGDRTGNHAFNNGRGLFFAGVLTDSVDEIDLAYEIFSERMPHLVTEDGFLREASSHYHYLFTRWVLEILWLSKKFKQEKFINFFTPYAEKLVKSCWFFLVQDRVGGSWTLPLIGDISPDFSPKWLIGLPWTKLALGVYRPKYLPECKDIQGWASLFEVESGDGEIIHSQSLYYPISGWHRIEVGKFLLFLRAHSKNGKVAADHAHSDLGGFALYYSGKPIFIDSGRIDYTNSDIGTYGRSAESHNTIFLDGLPPEASTPSWFTPYYNSVLVNTEFSQSDKLIIFKLSHNGFNRLNGSPVTHERVFSLTESRFKIEDHISGSSRRHIRQRFHLGPGVNLEERGQAGWSISSGEAELFTDTQLSKGIIINKKYSPLGGVCSSVYGSCEKCTTIELEGALTLPSILITELIWS